MYKAKLESKEDIVKRENTVSLNAETTKNLFEDLGYNLEGVRGGQKVKPIYLDNSFAHTNDVYSVL